jgi:putative spermidine/putrescine transport system substrate-binding protein
MASCQGIAVLALSLALLASAPASAEDEQAEGQVAAPTKELTIVSWGGAYTRSQMLAYVKPYRLLSGEWVSMETYNGGLEEIREQVETENVTWDVVDFELSDLIRGCREGLLEELDHGMLPPGDDGTPAADDFIPGAFTPCGVGQTVWSTVVGYDTEAVGESAPSTLADFFDVDEFPGKRGLRRDPRVILEWALIADGVPRDRVYQVLATAAGQARAFAKLDTIKDQVVWYESWSQAPQLLNDGGAVLVQSANGRIYKDIEDYDRPFVIVWDGNVFDLDVWSVVRGTPNRERAFEFVAFATQTTPLSGMQDVAYGPTRRSAAQLVDPNVRDELPTAHIDEGLKVDSAFWADFGEGLEEEFSRWLLN